MSEKLDQYLKLDKEIKAAETQKEALKSYVQRLLRRCRKWGIKVPYFAYTEATRFEFIDEKLYNWVASKVTAEQLEYLTKRSISLEKLEQYTLDGTIDSTLIPEECYIKTTYGTVRVKNK